MAVVNSKSSVNRGLFRRVLLLAVFLLPLAAAIAFGTVYYKKYQQLNSMSAEQFSKRDNERLVKDVAKVFSLPKDEQPSTVATVSDKEALKKQYPFFDQAENGDVVLIYQKAQLALIYRPSTKQVVKSGPINVQNPLRVKVVGDESARKALVKTLTDSKITATDGGAAKGSTNGVIVVDVSGKNGEQAKTLATLVKGQVGALPAGEDNPTDADLLVIVGPATP